MTWFDTSALRPWVGGAFTVALLVGGIAIPTAASADPLTTSTASSADDGVYADGRDHWALLRLSTVNRNLDSPDNAPGQSGRLFLDQGRFSGLVDGTIGYQTPFRGEQTRWHGYFVFDMYVGVQVIEQLELNLNLTIFNPSASDGYRTSADILPGFTIHLHETFSVAGSPLRIDIVGFDLDVVTTGVGLFFEQLPVEGWMIGARYRGYELRLTWAGRALFSDDNFLFAAATMLDGRLGVTYTSWFGDLSTSELDPNDVALDAFHAVYVGAFTDIEIFDGVRLAAEYAARIDQGEVRSAAMARLDWRATGDIGVPIDVHIGYQARLYLSQFGPRSIQVAPTQAPNTPRRENIYVTNSFEYFEYTPFFDQWSHTGMFEVSVRPLPQWRLYGHAEVWHRASEAAVPRVTYNQRFGRLPGVHNELFYRVGIEFFPWSQWPHRMTVYATNKAVVAVTDVRDALPNRFDHRDFVYIEGIFQL